MTSDFRHIKTGYALSIPHEASNALPCNIRSGGRNREQSPHYVWEGLKRKDGNQVIFQYTLSGQGYLRYEKNEYLINAGDFMLFPSPGDYLYKIAEGGYWEHFFISFEGAFCEQVTKRFVETQGPVRSLPLEHPLIQHAIKLYNFFHASRGGDAFSSSRLAYDFMLNIWQWLNNPSLMRQQQHEDIRRSIAFMRQHMHKTISIEEVAEYLGLSRSYFSRLFKAYMNQSPIDYLQQLRLNESFKKLRISEESIEEIALKCGFTSLNYFSRFFKSKTGMTPSEFRRQHA